MTKNATLPNQSPLSVQTIVIAATAWAVIALLFFLLFSVGTPAAGRPDWYTAMTYVFEVVAFTSAGALCFRNWRSSQIVSGRGVWLAIGLGMFSYAIGNILMGYWEVVWGKPPNISPGDLFFMLTYLFWGWGMFQAVLARKLSLTALQWVILGCVAAAGIGVAGIFAPKPTTAPLPPSPPAQVSPQAQNSNSAIPQAQSFLLATAAPAMSAPATATPAEGTAVGSPDAAADEKQSNAPTWAIELAKQLEPFATLVNWLYIVGDIILVVMASMLLLAFWGGKYSLSWRFIAAASFSFYIADIWFNYANNYIEKYESGALPEVFWVFSGCLMAIGAALEYDLSTRRRTARRRA